MAVWHIAVAGALAALAVPRRHGRYAGRRVRVQDQHDV